MANLNLSEFTEKLFVADADHTFIWDTAASISKRVSRNSWLSGTTADFHLGLADAASPVAQTISVQSVVAGTSNTAGANLSINGSQGTGTGAGGSLLLRTAPAGSSGTAQNALVTAVAITSAGNVGIGTTAPTSGLHISGPLGTDGGTYNSSAAIKLTNTTTNNSWLITSGLVGVANAHFSIRRESIALPALTIAGITDNVGIGTTSPTSKLHVEGGQILVSTGANDGVPGYGFSAASNNGMNFVTDGFGNGMTFIVNSTRKLTVQNNRILAATNLQITGTIQPERATMVDKAAGFTLAAVDAGTVINSTSATAITINLPAADTAAGYNVMIIQSGAGAVTINANGNTLNSFGNALITAGQHAACSIVRTAASTYNLSGNLV